MLNHFRRRLIGLAALMAAVGPTMASMVPEPVWFRKAYYQGHEQVHFLIAGPNYAVTPMRTPLVLLHPTAQSGDFFRTIMGELARDRVVLAPDTPGYGASDLRNPSDYGILNYAHHLGIALRAALADLGHERADIGGNHTGAFLAASMAIHFPDLTRRVLLSAVPYWPPGPERERLLDEIGRDRPLPEELSGLAAPWQYHVAQRNPAVPLERAFASFVAQLRSEPHHARAFRAVFSWPAETELPKLSQPVAVLNILGSLEVQTRDAAALIPNARVLEVDGFTTGAWEVGAAELARHIRTLLDEWDGEAAPR